MTVILECIAEQHRRNCKQAERGQAIHKILGESSIIRPKVKLAFAITVLTMKYRRERESLPVKRTVLIRPLSIGYFEFAANSRHRCGLVRGAPADPNAD
jgi:hypothetical protein